VLGRDKDRQACLQESTRTKDKAEAKRIAVDVMAGFQGTLRRAEALAASKAAGCKVIRAEKRSGTTTAGREELRTVLDFLRKGDVLMVTRIDCLARSIGDLQDIVRTIKARGASLALAITVEQNSRLIPARRATR